MAMKLKLDLREVLAPMVLVPPHPKMVDVITTGGGGWVLRRSLSRVPAAKRSREYVGTVLCSQK